MPYATQDIKPNFEYRYPSQEPLLCYRIATLNQSIFEKQSDLQQLHGALSAKDVEIQEAKSETIQFRLALDSVRLEIVGLKKRLHESERRYVSVNYFSIKISWPTVVTRLQLEIASKGELQQQLLDVQGKMKREIAVYQQVGCMHRVSCHRVF